MYLLHIFIGKWAIVLHLKEEVWHRLYCEGKEIEG
tara:strand:- start:87 stop:191 length:105 start_codon:yes stop_codon:yes gene_type:complete